MGSKDIFSQNSVGSDNHWASISDMMSGLMIIFMFISVAYMNSVTKERDAARYERDTATQAREKIEEIVVTWNNIQDVLFLDLEREFKNDLKRWRASLNRDTLSVRFEEPSVFFKAGSSELTSGFKEILNDFFPRYINVLRRYQDNIAEVRIEGHTSSEWEGAKSGLDAYFNNMQLSQNRTRSVLQYCLTLPLMSRHEQWAVSTITANGLSSSNLIRDAKGQEDKSLSRRVEFRVRTDAEKRIITILENI